ncbi:cytochrome c [Roseomonas sp. HJA6]|uniref:Cytochrome c n=1 Tax=Roseomonas alba TaxID=2846776 RepID=A0ABS7AHT3_9PROT|nr:cytochrome c [Neoroseomonas alba]MBW6401877.1 cytochrome c [Neoroseomonas alba]
MRRLAATLILLAGTALPALAQTEPGDPAAGRRLAETWCANCHRIAPQGPGPVSDAAPAFAAVAAMPSTTRMALAAFLQTPHPRMPNYQLSREEMDDVIAYLLSLRR